VWPILRRAELSLIEEAASGRGGVVLTGPAGVGKTTLLELAQELFEASGCAAVRISGSASLAGVPLSAFARYATEGATGLHDVLSGAWRALEAAAGPRGLAVLVDDAQFLDDASAGLLYQLAACGAAKVLLAVRSGEAVPEAVMSLWKDGHCERLELSTLTRSQVEDVVGQALQGRVDGATAHDLWRVSGGNLLYLRELVRSGLEGGALAPRGEIWTWSGSPGVPARLTELVSARLVTLGPEERLALDLVALAEPIAPSLVAGVTSFEAIESLEQRQLVQLNENEGDACLSVDHPLIGDVLRQTLAPLAARRLRRRLVDEIKGQRVIASRDLLRVAAWQLEWGEAGDPELLLEAARWYAQADPRVAERLAAQAALGPARLDAHLLLAQLTAAAGEPRVAEQRLARTHVRDEWERAAVAVARAEIQLCDLGDHEAANQILAAAAITVSGAALRTELAALRCRVDALRAAPRAGEAAAHLSAESHLSPSARAWLLVTRLEGLLWTGDVAEAAALWDSATDELAASRSECPLAVQQAQLAGLVAAAWRDGPDLALPLAREAYEAAITGGSSLGHGPTALALGELLLWSGTVEDAIWCLQEASITLVRARPYVGRCLDALATALALAGEVELAYERLAESAVVDPGRAEHACAHQRAWACLEAANGKRFDALRRLHAAGERAAAAEARLELVQIAHDLARLGDARSAIRFIQAAGPAARAGVAALLVEHSAALAGRRPQPITAVATRFSQVGLHRYAAEAELAAADRFMAEGQRAAAAAASRRASELITSCGPLQLTAEAALSGPVALTAREREIATLASQGLRDQEISDHLSLSVRTVQTHLHHAYCKLGVHSRQALGAALGLGEPAPRQG
jgi:DNA-binding NarL/FixJ family response regulator